jgi:hypothetical protein
MQKESEKDYLIRRELNEGDGVAKGFSPVAAFRRRGRDKKRTEIRRRAVKITGYKKDKYT